MVISTEHLKRCIETLEKSYSLIKTTTEGSVDFEMYRNSLVKSFEITLEQAGKLLKKRLEPYFANNKAVDKLNFKDIFRQALKHSLITKDELERWFKYRDNRNNTAHDYGQAFAEETLILIETFLQDIHNLKKVIEDEKSYN